MVTNKSLEQKLDKVVTLLEATVTPAVEEAKPTASQEVLYADPYLESLMNRKMEIINKPLDIRLVRTKSGITEVNYTKLHLNMIDDQINDWRDRKTHNKVR